MSEHDEQALVVSVFRARWPDVVIASIPNGVPLTGLTQRGRARVMNWLKAEGLLPGMPDLIIYRAAMTPPDEDGVVKIWHGMALEMKRSDGGTLRDNQREVLAMLERAGYWTAVAHGYDEAMGLIEEYMGWRTAPTAMRLVEEGK